MDTRELKNNKFIKSKRVTVWRFMKPLGSYPCFHASGGSCRGLPGTGYFLCGRKTVKLPKCCNPYEVYEEKQYGTDEPANSYEKDGFKETKIENLRNLDKCGNELFWFSCCPLKLEDCDGSPIRAIAWFE